jgi:hypothetical protein
MRAHYNTLHVLTICRCGTGSDATANGYLDAELVAINIFGLRIPLGNFYKFFYRTEMGYRGGFLIAIMLKKRTNGKE